MQVVSYNNNISQKLYVYVSLQAVGKHTTYIIFKLLCVGGGMVLWCSCVCVCLLSFFFSLSHVHCGALFIPVGS